MPAGGRRGRRAGSGTSSFGVEPRPGRRPPRSARCAASSSRPSGWRRGVGQALMRARPRATCRPRLRHRDACGRSRPTSAPTASTRRTASTRDGAERARGGLGGHARGALPAPPAVACRRRAHRQPAARRAVHDAGRLRDPRGRRPGERQRRQPEPRGGAPCPPGGETIEHFHRVTRGDLLLHARQRPDAPRREERDVGPGDTVVIAPGVRHKLWATGTEPLRLLCCCAPRLLRRGHGAHRVAGLHFLKPWSHGSTTGRAGESTATSSRRSATRRSSSCAVSAPSPACASTRSSRATTRPARSRTASRAR